MTSPTPFSDEELSAAIDGDLDADRSAALEADPIARERRDALAAAAQAVARRVDPLDPAVVDGLIAGALDAPLAPAAPRRGSRGPQPWLVAAVVAVLVAVGLGLVWSGRNADQEQRASFDTVGASIGAEDSGAAKGDGADASSSASEMESGAPTTTAPPASALPPAVALGEFASGDDLRSALAEAFPTADAATTTSGEVGTESSVLAPPPAGALERCGDQLEVTLDLDDPPTRTGYATVDGRAVLVYEFDAPSFADGTPTTLVAAVGQDACDQVVIFQR